VKKAPNRGKKPSKDSQKPQENFYEEPERVFPSDDQVEESSGWEEGDESGGEAYVADETLYVPAVMPAKKKPARPKQEFEEDLRLDNGPALEACRLGLPQHAKKQHMCLAKFKAAKGVGEGCTWLEEVKTYYQSKLPAGVKMDQIKRLSGLPCKNPMGKVKMKEYPKPGCTKPTAMTKTEITLCDSWGAVVRDTPDLQGLWYQQVGVWESFRQPSFNAKPEMYTYAKHICKKIGKNTSILEYGSGVAPYSTFSLDECKNKIAKVSILDMASEHYYFALWRLRYRLETMYPGAGEKVLRGYEAHGEVDPFNEGQMYDMVISITVFEHLPNPLEIATKMLDSLNPGGWFFEDYCTDDPTPEEELAKKSNIYDEPDLESSRVERPDVINLLLSRCKLDTWCKGGGKNVPRGQMGCRTGPTDPDTIVRLRLSPERRCDKVLWKCNM